MTEFCQDHSQLVKSVGELHGKMDMLIAGQKDVKDNISELYGKINISDKDQAVQKTKLAPVFWVIITVGAYLIIDFVKGFLHK